MLLSVFGGFVPVFDAELWVTVNGFNNGSNFGGIPILVIAVSSLAWLTLSKTFPSHEVVCEFRGQLLPEVLVLLRIKSGCAVDLFFLKPYCDLSILSPMCGTILFRMVMARIL